MWRYNVGLLLFFFLGLKYFCELQNEAETDEILSSMTSPTLLLSVTMIEAMLGGIPGCLGPGLEAGAGEEALEEGAVGGGVRPGMVAVGVRRES